MATLDELITQFLEYLELERNVSKLTIRNYRHYLIRFHTWLKTFSSTPPDPSTIDAEMVRRYRLYLSRFADEKGLTLKRITQNYHLIALRSFLKFLAKRDVVSLVSDRIELGKAESHSLHYLSRDQVERLLATPSISTASGLRDKVILEVLFSTGLRVSELVSLNRNQLNFETREIGVIGKGRKPRVVFLSVEASSWLQRYLTQREDEYVPVFIRYGGRKPKPDDTTGESFRLTSRSVQRIVAEYVQKAKLPIKITPHGLRHSFATDLLTAGADLRAIQEMLGHKNVSTTQIYTHVTNPQLKRIHEEFHGK